MENDHVLGVFHFGPLHLLNHPVAEVLAESPVVGDMRADTRKQEREEAMVIRKLEHKP